MVIRNGESERTVTPSESKSNSPISSNLSKSVEAADLLYTELLATKSTEDGEKNARKSNRKIKSVSDKLNITTNNLFIQLKVFIVEIEAQVYTVRSEWTRTEKKTNNNRI